MFGVLSNGTRKINWVRSPTGLFQIVLYRMVSLRSTELSEMICLVIGYIFAMRRYLPEMVVINRGQNC